MISKYRVGFLIPKDTSCNLSDDGWEFASCSRVNKSVECLISEKYSLVESSNDFSSYEGQSIKISVFKDMRGDIEHIYFRFYDDLLPKLPTIFQELSSLNDLEFFVPA